MEPGQSAEPCQDVGLMSFVLYCPAVGLSLWDFPWCVGASTSPPSFPLVSQRPGSISSTPLQLWPQMQLGSLILLSRDIRKTNKAEALRVYWAFVGDVSNIPLSGHGHHAYLGTGPRGVVPGGQLLCFFQCVWNQLVSISDSTVVRTAK